ncbi:MAG: aconitate hydratase AcnA [Chloroflexi bacterium HGW-Chloroflexi-3]|nr:MAG: aconitate hydratase AcnA [Chloroflexi bacterium HGW-Chloroflexi-3]
MNKGLPSTKSTLSTNGKVYHYFQLSKLHPENPGYLERLPFSIRVLLEGVLRNINGKTITEIDAINLASWQPHQDQRKPVPFFPGRVVLQDFTGVPVVNDLAAMRAAIQRIGGDPLKVNPIIPVDLVIDHSVMVDISAKKEAVNQNAKNEFERNFERYQFLRWSSSAFKNLRIIPPSTGIIHQVNLEFLAQSVLTHEKDGETYIYPDTLVGTDSHTTMINGLGIVGWGVGGIEAIAAMMGQPIEILTPDVIGVHLKGQLKEGLTPTDLTLTIIQILRKKGVVDKFVEFFGEGLDHLSLADRAMIANITPESGATMIYFPFDVQSLNYLRLTGKNEEHLNLVEKYYRAQNLFRESQQPFPGFSEVIEVDLDQIEPSIAGPKRPQDRMGLQSVKENFQISMAKPRNQMGFGYPENEAEKKFSLYFAGKSYQLSQGFTAIAAITSCTNTSNPTVMIAAGLVAKKAVSKGLTIPEYVKTSFAPGSRVVTEYLTESSLIVYLENLGFHIVGYGCTTCIGNSGPLHEEIVDYIEKEKIIASAVLSGNRNFEGRIHPHIQANYLASPPLVVAYALAGTINIDLTKDPIGYDPTGKPVFLHDIWPTSSEIQEILHSVVKPDLFIKNYANVFSGNFDWNMLQTSTEKIYDWDKDSTYLQEPPYFENLSREGSSVSIVNAHALVVLGDSVTTDHISPAGAIPLKSPAGEFLVNHGVQPQDFNSFGSRRGNDRIMTRGTFGNIRIKNLLLTGVEGGMTRYIPSGEVMSIYEASQKYQQEGIDLIVIAGKEYGTGSSRDWAAKGPKLLGVKAVIAESFERIHRSNLVGMGILPLEFLPGENIITLGLDGSEKFTINNTEDIFPGKIHQIKAVNNNGKQIYFDVKLRIDTLIEIQYFKDGGIMNTILKDLIATR